MNPTAPDRSLGYETPRRMDEVVVAPDGDALRVELGPVSTAVLVTQIATWSIGIAGAAGMLMYVGREWRGPAFRVWLVMPFAMAACVLVILLLARHRRVPRTFVVQGGMLLYANAMTGGRLIAVPPEKARRIVVRRCWWRPWMCQLDADPAVGFLSTKRGGQAEPRTLAFDGDRSKLERVAGELRRALGIG